MYELNAFEIDSVNGGAGKAQPKAGSLARPSKGESERGKEFNDIAFALDAFGSWVGITVYDLLH